MRPAALNFPPNPDYGLGACVRQVSLCSEAGIVRGHLADNFHEMRCTIVHEAGVITRISTETLRIPTTACPAAASEIKAFVGLPTGTPRRHFYRDGRARHHCTHLLDLVVMAIGRAAIFPSRVRYQACVPDEIDRPVCITILRNGDAVHEWRIREGIIIDPIALRGKTLDRGFAAWASVAFDDEAFEAATILARTWLVSIGRRYLPAAMAGQAALTNPQMLGRCYAYSMPQVAKAVLTGEEEAQPDL